MSRVPLLPRLAGGLLLLATSPVFAANGIWSLLPNSPTVLSGRRHDDLTFVDENRGWLVNGEGQIYRTQDGGNTWTHLKYTGVYNRAVAFFDSLTGVVGYLYQSGGTALTMTTDGGLTWNPVALPSPVPQGICGMYAASENVLYGVGAYYGSPTMVKSTDHGQTWTTKGMFPYCGALVDCYFWAPDSGIAVGSTSPGPNRQPRILMTVDGGNNWSVPWTGTRLQELCWKISFVNRNVGFVSIENLAGAGASYYLKTTDGGLTWTEHLFHDDAYYNCQGIGFADETTGWIGGWNFETQITADGGTLWSPAGFGMNMNRFRFLNPKLGYACGDRVYKWTTDLGSVSGAPEPETPAARLLEQNTPNPFLRETRIRFQVNREGPVALRLYDVQGREVRRLDFGVRAPGRYEEVVDASDLAPGVYFYELATADGRESRKMWRIR